MTLTSRASWDQRGEGRALEPSPGAALSFHAVIGCHWLSFLRDLDRNLAVVAVTFCQNDSVAPGYLNLPSAAPFATGCVEVVKTSNTWFAHKIMQFSSSHRLVSHRPCIEDRDAVYKIAFGFSCNKRNVGDDFSSF